MVDESCVVFFTCGCACVAQRGGGGLVKEDHVEFDLFCAVWGKGGDSGERHFVEGGVEVDEEIGDETDDGVCLFDVDVLLGQRWLFGSGRHVSNGGQ